MLPFGILGYSGLQNSKHRFTRAKNAKHLRSLPVPVVVGESTKLSTPVDIGFQACTPDSRLAEAKDTVVDHEYEWDHSQSKAGAPHLTNTQ